MDLFTSRFKKIVAPLLGALLMVSLTSAIIPAPTHAAPVIILVAAVVAAAAVVTVDYYSCAVNLIWGCTGPSGGSSSGANSSSSPGDDGSKSGNQSGNNSQAGNNSGASGNGTEAGGQNGSAAQACSSAANVCGMTHTSFLNSSGVCPAVAPLDSACPAPTVSSFYANPLRVDKGATSTLNWSVTGATVCAITGGGLSLSALGITGTIPTGAITGDTSFTLNCQEGTGPLTSSQTVVKLIPVYQEQ